MTLVAMALWLVTLTPAQGPCLAVHYGRTGVAGEASMSEVVHNRLTEPKYSIPGFAPRPDVAGYIAVRYLDRWRIGENWRALVTFRLPGGGYSDPLWLQPADYQQKRHVRSSQCRVETSATLARSQGWSSYQGRGRTQAYILRWEH